MFDKQDPVGAMAYKMGELFAIMVSEMEKELGEERGLEVAARAVDRFGAMRGSRVRQAVLDAGKELTFENMEEFYDMPPNHAWDSDSVIEGDVMTEDTRYCPFASAWRALGLEKEGEIYCRIDYAIHNAFFGDIKFERPAIFSDGPDAPCRMVVTRLSKPE